MVLSGFLLLSCSKASAANWRYLGQTPDASYYYDAKDTVRQGNSLKVWMKAVYSKEGRSEEEKKLGGGYSNLTDAKALVKINCRNEWHHVSMLVIHSMEETVIVSGFREQQQDFRIPDSILKRFYRMACEYKRSSMAVPDPTYQ